MNAPLLTMPRVHLNGTSKGALLEQYEAAYRAINAALPVLCASAPNARDYYVIHPGAFGAAQEEHDARVRTLLTVRDELLALYEHLAG